MKSCMRALLFGLLTVLGTIARADAPSDSTAADSRRGAFVIGPLVGLPAGIGMMAGIETAPLSVKVSGGYWGKDWNGIQADLGWLFTTEGLLTQGVFIVAGTYRVNPRLPNDQGLVVSTIRQNRFVGIAYEADYAGFFLQAGLARGWGDYPNPQGLLQAGYLISIP